MYSLWQERVKTDLLKRVIEANDGESITVETTGPLKKRIRTIFTGILRKY